MSGEEGEEADDAEPQPIADAAIDLAAGARYTATGKRKTAVARVILKPGTGAYEINGRTLEQHFPRNTLQRNIRQPLETVGYESRMDVVALMHGGGVSAQAGALRHGISRALLEADPNLRSELKRRGFLTRDARVKERKKAGLKKARKRPQFSQEVVGPAHCGARRHPQALRHRRRPRRRGRVPLRRARALARPRAPRRVISEPRRPARACSSIRDTRESGEMLEAAVAAGIAAAGGEALLGGVLPTPGAPLLIERYGFDLAVVLSASHNPYQDNGIKFFGGDGFKLSDAVELEIEAMLAAPPPAPRIGRVRRFHGALEDYLRALHERFAELDLTGRRVLLDCANGATFEAGAGDLPPPRRPRRRDGGRAGRPQHQRRLRLDAPRPAAGGAARPAATTSASPSTATATACSPSTGPAP